MFVEKAKFYYFERYRESTDEELMLPGGQISRVQIRNLATKTQVSVFFAIFEKVVFSFFLPDFAQITGKIGREETTAKKAEPTWFSVISEVKEHHTILLI